MELELLTDSFVLSLKESALFILYLLWAGAIFIFGVNSLRLERHRTTAPFSIMVLWFLLSSVLFLITTHELYRPAVIIAMTSLLTIVGIYAYTQCSVDQLRWSQNDVVSVSDSAERRNMLTCSYLKDLAYGVAFSCLAMSHHLDDGFAPVVTCLALLLIVDVVFSNKTNIYVLDTSTTVHGVARHARTGMMFCASGLIVLMFSSFIVDEVSALAVLTSITFFFLYAVTRILIMWLVRKKLRTTGHLSFM